MIETHLFEDSMEKMVTFVVVMGSGGGKWGALSFLGLAFLLLLWPNLPCWGVVLWAGHL